MFERRHLLYFLATLALLLAPFALVAQPAQAATQVFYVDRLDDTAVPSDTACANSNPSDGDCSLRQAIARANSWSPAGDLKQISFSLFTSGQIAISGPIIVDSTKRLPPITASNVQILAETSFGFPQIAIDANGNDAGLVIQSSDNIVKGLSIYGASGGGGVYRGTGVYITGARNKVQLCFLGIKTDSSLPTLRNAYGVYITGAGASNNEVGGSGGDAVANYVSGNSINGIVIANASNNTIQNNFVGIKRTGLSSLALEKNDSYGIQVFSDTSQDSTAKSQINLIGGPTSDLANIIGGNGQAGINVSGTRTFTTTIQVNYIGIYRDTDPDFGNILDGIRIEDGATATQVGGTTNNPLVISDNGGYGVYIRTGDSSTPPVNTTITGVTYIGTTRAGNAARGNGTGGVRIDLAARNSQIIGANNSVRISGNQGPGVWMNGAYITGSRIDGAVIGVNVGAGASPVANTGGGVLVQGGAQKTTISGNTISGNTGFGVRLSATKTVTITGNYIGLDTNRTGTVVSSGPGIDVLNGSSNTLIGGSTATRNYLAGNGTAAISITGPSTVSTTVSSNIIGLANDGSGNPTVAAGNGGDGVLVSGGPQRTTVSSNRIASNTGAGVKIVGSNTTTVTLSLNSIGWASGVTAGRPNVTGITIDSARAVDVLTNTVRYNSGSGIFATSAQTVTLRSNQVYSQTLGSGIQIGGASNNVRVLTNTLLLNGDYGVLVQGTSQRVRMQYNMISGNTDGGVKLEGTSIYSGSGADDSPLTLPNHGIDPPIFDPANTKPLRLRVDETGVFSGYVYTNTATLPASACSPIASCQIQFFRPGDTADGQGYSVYKVTPVDGGNPSDFATPNAKGLVKGRIAFGPAEVLPSQLIFATTDALGNTSEFGILNVTPALSLNYLSTADGKQNAAPGQTVTYTLSLVNSGTVDFTNLNVTTHNSLARWAVAPTNDSTNQLSLPANSSKTLTVTLKLPSGTDLNVRAGVQDKTSVIATVAGQLPQTLLKSRIITTTVTATPVVVATTLKGSGTAPPTGTVTHTHRFTNTGNVTVTLDLTYRTIDPADSGYIWATSLSASSLEIPPGQNKTVDVTVTVPNGAQVYDAAKKLVVVTTVVTGTARSPFGSIVKVVSGTTGVDLVPRAQMSGNGVTEQAASFAEVTFDHSVLNTSNGPARFCLKSKSNSGSTVASYSSQNGVAISAPSLGSCFALDAPNGTAPLLRFKVTIKVTGTLLPGDVDSVDISLTDADTGKEIPNASVRDNISITSSPVLPRIWLPLAAR